jgi:anaerobic magnesium-protoporphyrin IX monomethyl ester cyclase
VGDRNVVFIGFQDQENLGLGYLASAVLDAGFSPHILDYRLGAERLCASCAKLRPLCIGFSIIFQYYTPNFRDIAAHFRERGITCHFTAGGHYPSLRPTQVLESVDALDSIVLFEGEHTFRELVEALANNRDWRGINGLAFRRGGALVTNPLRPLETDLDRFAPPVRAPLPEFALGKQQTTILASRGCYYNCSFCSIRNFYSKPPGPLKRVRQPEMVAREMELLQTERDCAVFMFQDDDFPGAARGGAAWAQRFCQALARSGLARQVLWRISCRCDEVGLERFALLKDAGLAFVYLGIESGTSAGLDVMNKHLTVGANVEAARILDCLGINWDFGFMLFDPLSTYDSILGNLAFLEEICGGGSAPVTACKMIPYAETPIEKALEEAGRLIVHGEREDYRFLDPGLDRLYSFWADLFSNWIQSSESVLGLSRWTRYAITICRKFFGGGPDLDEAAATVRRLTAESNRFFLDATQDMVRLYSNWGGMPPFTQTSLRSHVRAGEQKYASGLLKAMNQLTATAGAPQPASV